jgi:hypothetical protein
MKLTEPQINLSALSTWPANTYNYWENKTEALILSGGCATFVSDCTSCYLKCLQNVIMPSCDPENNPLMYVTID